MKAKLKMGAHEYFGELCIGRFEEKLPDFWYWQFHPYSETEIRPILNNLGRETRRGAFRAAVSNGIVVEDDVRDSQHEPRAVIIPSRNPDE